MHSETPRDRHAADADHAPGHDRPDTPGSLGRELTEHTNTASRDAIPAMSSDGLDPGATLMPHERKLSAAEQQSVLAMRRHADDGVDNSEIKMQLQMEAERALRIQEWRLEHPGGHAHASKSHSASHASHAAHSLGGLVWLDQIHHPLNAVYDAVHKGIGAQDASRLSLNPSEHANTAGALTAHLSQTPGFDRSKFDPANLSVALSEGNDRLFAIQGRTPGAPDAIYAAVAVDQAKQQPLEVSSAQAMIEPPKPAPQAQGQAQEQPQQDAPTIAPRSLG